MKKNEYILKYKIIISVSNEKIMEDEDMVSGISNKFWLARRAHSKKGRG